MKKEKIKYNIIYNIKDDLQLSKSEKKEIITRKLLKVIKYLELDTSIINKNDI